MSGQGLTEDRVDLIIGDIKYFDPPEMRNAS
jgi:hypothetical protein